MVVIDNAVKPYLAGEKFDNGLRVRIAEKQKLFSRIEFLVRYAEGKKVIHMGCADHIPIILEKVQNNTWLHKRIDQVAQKQIGIDILPEAVEYIRKELGFANILTLDIVKDPVPEEIKSDLWDCMILGEIVEHIDNPVEFLTEIRQKYAPFVKEIVITVPNALSVSNFYQAIGKNTEKINTDHRYWFTPFTMQKILIRSGFKPLYHEFATYYPLNKKKPVRNFLLRTLLVNRPALRGNLIMVAEF